MERSCILVQGNVPGPKKGYVLIRSAVKGGKNEAKELVTYVIEEVTENEVKEEVVTEEVIDEPVAETSENNEEETTQKDGE